MPNKTVCPSSVPSIRNKDIKIRIHHLSHYFVRLTYNATEKHSLNMHLVLKNYSDMPVKNDAVLETNFKIFMTPFAVMRENMCACGINKIIEDKYAPTFRSLFRELEKVIDSIIEISMDTRNVKKEVSDKNERRKKLKSLKKARLQAEASLVTIVRRELRV